MCKSHVFYQINLINDNVLLILDLQEKMFCIRQIMLPGKGKVLYMNQIDYSLTPFIFFFPPNYFFILG